MLLQVRRQTFIPEHLPDAFQFLVDSVARDSKLLAEGGLSHPGRYAGDDPALAFVEPSGDPLQVDGGCNVGLDLPVRGEQLPKERSIGVSRRGGRVQRKRRVTGTSLLGPPSTRQILERCSHDFAQESPARGTAAPVELVALRPPACQAFLEEVVELQVTWEPPLGDEVIDPPADEIELPRLKAAAPAGSVRGCSRHPFLLDSIRRA